MPTSFLGSLVSGGQLGAGFSNQSTNTSSQFQQNQNFNQTGTTSRNLTPYQTQLQGPLFDYIRSLMLDPTKAVAPFQAGARNNVNENYSGLSDSLRNQFLSTGGGKSGKYGMAATAGTISRLRDLSNVDTGFAQT